MLAAGFFSDFSSWGPAANTALMIVLFRTQNRTKKAAQKAQAAAEDASDSALAAVEVAAHTRRIAKESHNQLADIMQQKYEDAIDATTGKFNRRSDDPKSEGTA